MLLYLVVAGVALALFAGLWDRYRRPSIPERYLNIPEPTKNLLGQPPLLVEE